RPGSRPRRRGRPSARPRAGSAAPRRPRSGSTAAPAPSCDSLSSPSRRNGVRGYDRGAPRAAPRSRRARVRVPGAGRYSEMPAVLAQHSYGKSRIRLTKVTRHADRHDVRELLIEISLEGDFAGSYTHGDNRLIIPTDTMKNVTYVLAREHALD